MSAGVDRLYARGALADVDFYFARALSELAAGARDEVVLAAALASRAVGQGHVCLDLATLAAGGPLCDDSGAPIDADPWPPLAEWVAALRASPLVTADSETYAPLVLEGSRRLYLRRYWLYECAVADAIAGRAALPDGAVDRAVLRDGLQRLFPPRTDSTAPNWQRLAAATAVWQRFCVISGGPGTGKTYTVVRILALLIEQALAQGGVPPRIALLAPTGKAAARLKQAVRDGMAELNCSAAVRTALPDEAATIHRALGAVPGHASRFRHHRAHPLPADIALVDEASMVDVALMARLLDALPPPARLVLLGDQDQLASVEAGAVLADICNSGVPKRFSPPFASDLSAVAGERLPAEHIGTEVVGLADCIVPLVHSYRYRAGGGIGRLAQAINAGDLGGVWAALAGDAEVTWLEDDGSGSLGEALRPLVLDGLAAYCRASDPLVRLRGLDAFRVLCAHRRGPGGVEALNGEIERLLSDRGTIDPRQGAWYDGRPILVTQNDYAVRLFNGDVGLIAGTGEPSGARRACFLDGDGGLRAIAPGRLPPHETVFAMSVHKSQGSEFDTAIVVLPPEPSPLLSRELLYTAVTRARRRLVLVGSRAVIAHAIAHRLARASGLRERLWR